MKKQSIKVVHNIWGNWVCYIGTARVETFGAEFDAQFWLNEKLAEGNYTLSAKSDLQQKQQF